MKYTCNNCGREHEEWPALTFHTPDGYHCLSDEDKTTIAEISNDFCVVTHPDQTDRYIRCTLTLKVNDHCEDLDYGVWVSLSEKSFNDYKLNYDNENHEVSYFGWLANDIWGYEFDDSIPTTVFTRTGDKRPEIVPHQDVDHPLVKDYYNGISKEEAERRVQEMIG